MKKTTIVAIRNYLNGENVDLETLRNEVEEEYQRVVAPSVEKANARDALKPQILAAMSEEPMTAKEIYEKAGLPEDVALGTVVYILTRDLAGEVKKHSGKGSNKYSL